MFRQISINPVINQGKKKCTQSFNAFKANFSFGLPEWQQEDISTYQQNFYKKRLLNNRFILKQKYLNKNYSQISLAHSLSIPILKDQFLSSNNRDFKRRNNSNLYLESLSQIDESKKRKKKSLSSGIVMGENLDKKNSIYSHDFIEPIKQRNRYDYNKVKFRYNAYTINPLTQELIKKDPNKMYPFDYFNIDRIKKYRHKSDNDVNNSFNLRQVYDPITHRFFHRNLIVLPKI